MQSLSSNINIILGFTSIIGVLLSVFLYFRNPQEALDKRQALAEKNADGKSNLIEEKMKWEKDLSEKQFGDINERISTVLAMAQNHIHTVDTKVDELTKVVNSMNIQVTGEIAKLSTIIDERIPKNKNK